MSDYRKEHEAGSLEAARAEAAKRQEEKKKKKIVTKKRSYVEGTRDYRAELEAGSLESAKAAQATPSTSSPALNLERAKEAIRQAESYKASYGSRVTWGDKTYDLGSIQGWKEYQQAVRDAKSELSAYERGLREYRFKSITTRAPEPATAQLGAGPTEVGPPKQATTADIERLRAEGYDLPLDKTIYISPSGEVYYYEETTQPTVVETRPPGIPGPAMGPRPGSFSERLQGVFYGYEERFQKLFGGVREERAKRLEIARTAKLEGRDVIAGVEFGKATGLAAVTAYGEGLTFLFRPVAWADTIGATYQLITSSEARGTAWKGVKADPLGFAISIPSVYLGGLTTAKIIQSARGPKIYTTTSTDPLGSKRISDIRKTRPTYTTKTKTIQVGAGFEKTLGFVPEEIEIVPGFTLSSGEGSVATPISKGSYPIGAYDKKLWGQTGAGLRPLTQAEAMIIPESMVETREVWRLITERIWGPGEKIPAYMPRVKSVIDPVLGDWMPRIVTTTKTVPRSVDVLHGSIGLGSLLKTIDVQTPVQALKTRQQLTQKLVSVQEQVPTQVQESLQISTPVEVQVSLQKEIQIQTPVQKQIQKQIQITSTTTTSKQIEIQKEVIKPPPTIFGPPKPLTQPKMLPNVFGEKPQRRVQAVDVFGSRGYKYRVIESVDILGTGSRGKVPNILGKKKKGEVPDIFGTSKKEEECEDILRHVNLWLSIIGLLFITYIAWGALAPIREEFATSFGDRVNSTLGADAAAADSNIDDHYGAAFNMMPVFITGLLLYIGFMAMQSRERVYQGGF